MLNRSQKLGPLAAPRLSQIAQRDRLMTRNRRAEKRGVDEYGNRGGERDGVATSARLVGGVQHGPQCQQRGGEGEQRHFHLEAVGNWGAFVSCRRLTETGDFNAELSCMKTNIRSPPPVLAR
jgi:hypothetical protein